MMSGCCCAQGASLDTRMMRFGFSSTWRAGKVSAGAGKQEKDVQTIVLRNGRAILAVSRGGGETGGIGNAHGEGETVLEVFKAGVPGV